MNPFLLLGAAVGFRFAPQIVSRLEQLPPLRASVFDPLAHEARGFAISWRGLHLEAWQDHPKGGDN